MNLKSETPILNGISVAFKKKVSTLNDSFNRDTNANSDKQLQEIIIDLENTNKEKDEVIKKQRLENIVCRHKLQKAINNNIKKKITKNEANSQVPKLGGGESKKFNNLTKFVIAINNPEKKENNEFLKNIVSELGKLISQKEINLINSNKPVPNNNEKKIPTDKELLESFKKKSDFILTQLKSGTGIGARLDKFIENYLDRDSIIKYFNTNSQWKGYFNEKTKENKDFIISNQKKEMKNSLEKYLLDNGQIFNKKEFYDKIEKAKQGDLESKKFLKNKKEKFYDLLKYENDLKILESDSQINTDLKKGDIKLKYLWLRDNSASIAENKDIEKQKIKGYLYKDLI
tara:strand:+ start:1626 stop:2657 length:1032 start_codon:yes stop_codon:yes gene_type:complete